MNALEPKSVSFRFKKGNIVFKKGMNICKNKEESKQRCF